MKDRRSQTRWQKAREPAFHGRAGNRLGTRNEIRVLRILTELETPDWIISSRAATPEEDAQKKDVIVLTDRGEIGVQVKSGVSGLIEFKRKASCDMIAAIMVKARYTDKQILKEILKELAEIRSAMDDAK